MQHGDKFELRINNQSFTHLWDNGKNLLMTFLMIYDICQFLFSFSYNSCFLERTKKNFNYEAGVASSRPPYDSVGGTDYAKPKNYDAYGTSSSKPVGEVREKKHVTIA